MGRQARSRFGGYGVSPLQLETAHCSRERSCTARKRRGHRVAVRLRSRTRERDTPDKVNGSTWTERKMPTAAQSSYHDDRGGDGICGGHGPAHTPRFRV